MKFKLGFIFLLGLILTVHGGYNCLRKGQQCKNNRPCENGVCNCTGFSGYNCDIKDGTTLSVESCSPQCENGGTCVNDTNIARCSCTEDFYGASCNVKRAQVDCKGDRQIIHLNPEGFQGELYISGKRGMSKCTFKSVGEFASGNDGYNAKWTEGWTLVVLDNSTECGAVNEVTSADNTTTTTERMVDRQYNPDIQSSLDERMTLKCELKNGHNRSLPSTVVSANIGSASYKNVSVTETYEPVVFNAMSNNVAVGATPLAIGDDLVFEFFIPEATGYVKLMIISLGANDGKDGGKSVKLIEDRCTTSDGNAIIMSQTSTDDGRKRSLKMTVFKFVDSSTVSFTGNIQICAANETACDTPTCPPQAAAAAATSGPAATTAAPAAPGRKRRSSGNQKEIVKDITVRDPSTTVSSSQQTDQCKDNTAVNTSDDLCFRKNDIVAAMTTFAIALLILIIACIVLVVKLWYRPPKVTAMPNTDYPPVTLPRLTAANF